MYRLIEFNSSPLSVLQIQEMYLWNWICDIMYHKLLFTIQTKKKLIEGDKSDYYLIDRLYYYLKYI